MSNKKRNAPKLRFPGFTDAWEQRKAVGIFKATAEKGYPNLPVLSATQDRGMILREDTGINIAYDKKNEPTYKRVLPGQFVIHLRSFQGGFAHSNIEGITSPAYTVLDFIDKKNHDDCFWKYIFNSENFVKRLEAVTYGIRDGRSISYGDFSEMTFLYPSSAEQKRIGEAFVIFDDLITLHQRKLNNMQELKKGLLQKMFPKDGANVPEIRFPGFTDAWEQRKVKDMFKVTRGYVLAAPDTSEKQTSEYPYPVYSSQTKSDGLMGYYRDFLYSDAITWTTDGANAGTVRMRSGKFYCTNVCGVLLSDEGYANKAITEALNNIAWRHVSRVGNPKLMNNVMSEISIWVPRSLEEQLHISELLSSLDHLITLHQRKLEHLKEQKKALLQQMFI